MKYLAVLGIILLAPALAAADTKSYTIALQQDPKVTQYAQDLLMAYSDPDSLDYGKSLTTSELFQLTYVPESEKVIDWLVQEGVQEYTNYGDAIVVIDEVSNIERMYRIKFTQKNGFYHSTEPYFVPPMFSKTILFIDGLSNPVKNTVQQVAAFNTPTVDPGLVGREVIQRLYGVSGWVTNSSTSAGAIEFQGGGFSQQDLNTSMTDNNVPPKTVYKTVGPNPGGGVESKLDMQMISITAPEVQLWYLNFPQWLFGFAVNITNTNHTAEVFSISYGWSEFQQCTIAQNCTDSSKYVNAVNAQFVKMGLRRLTVMVSSGDAGSPGRTDESCDPTNAISPAFPGASPWITSVGATFIVADNSTHDYTSELCKENKCATGTDLGVVNYNVTGWTTGGGFGVFSSENTPDWQADVVKEYLSSGVYLPKNSSSWNSKGRGYPDVAVIGHNCAVYMEGTPQGVDGTSCSSPVFAGMVAMWNDYLHRNGKPSLGFMNPLLYKVAKSDPSAFRSIQPGNTYCTEMECCTKEFGFSTPPKATMWNPVHGLGSPQADIILRFLMDQ